MMKAETALVVLGLVAIPIALGIYMTDLKEGRPSTGGAPAWNPRPRDHRPRRTQLAAPPQRPRMPRAVVPPSTTATSSASRFRPVRNPVRTPASARGHTRSLLP